MKWLRHGRRSTRHRIYVIKDRLQTNLLGHPAVNDLQLVSRINATKATQPEVVKQFLESSNVWEL